MQFGKRSGKRIAVYVFDCFQLDLLFRRRFFTPVQPLQQRQQIPQIMAVFVLFDHLSHEGIICFAQPFQQGLADDVLIFVPHSRHRRWCFLLLYRIWAEK